MRTLFKQAGILCALAFASSQALAAPTSIPRITQQPTIDGILDQDEWRSAVMYTLDYETDPAENVKPEVETKVYIAEDGETLYIAFEAFDPNHEEIRAYYRDRDRSYSDDFVGIVLDTFNDESRAYEFFANALGAQMDMIMNQNTGEDDSWDAIWDSAGQINQQGYVVEMAIPLNQLSFAQLDKQTWGIDLVRFRPRSTRQRISVFAKDRDNNCYLCQTIKITGFENLTPSANLTVVPTLTAEKSENREYDRETGQLDDWKTSTNDQEVGLDVKWGVTPNATLSATVNPDFSQVETDSTQFSVNQQFALFFEEKRPFFLESADYFNTQINTVYTRSIADPDAGLKYTGKHGNSTVGLMTGVDNVTNLILPSKDGSDRSSLKNQTTDAAEKSNFAVARYSYDLGNASNVGVIATNRQGDQYNNSVFGVDAKYRLDNANRVSFQVLRSSTDYPEYVYGFEEENDNSSQEPVALPTAYSGNALNIGYNHDQRNWYAYSNYRYIDKGFRADLGFVGQVDFDKFVAGGGYTWFGEKGDFLNRIRVNGDWDITHDNQGQLLEKEAEMHINLNGPLQSYFHGGVVSRDTVFRDKYHQETFYMNSFAMTPVDGFSFEIWRTAGDQIDYRHNQMGDVVDYGIWMKYNINKNLEFTLRNINANLDVPDGELYKLTAYDIKLTYQMDMKNRLRFTMQKGQTLKNVELYQRYAPEGKTIGDIPERERAAMQLLYSHVINPQTVFYLGYSDDGYSDDKIKSIEKNNRQLFLKVSYAWMPFG
jgi:hypothetical protein